MEIESSYEYHWFYVHATTGFILWKEICTCIPNLPSSDDVGDTGEVGVTDLCPRSISGESCFLVSGTD